METNSFSAIQELHTRKLIIRPVCFCCLMTAHLKLRRRMHNHPISVDLMIADTMDGLTFEYYCADLLKHNGFSHVELTKESGDQGIDILAEKDDIKYAIQCKCYSSNLGNRPVQEVYTGKSIYHCQIAAVLTNSYFTQGGIEAAMATGVLLWDRQKLVELIQNSKRKYSS